MVNSFNNIIRLSVVSKALSTLENKAIFVGGAVVELYTDDPAKAEVRPTDDIDVVIEVLNRASHAEFEEKIRAIGFINHIESGVICRYKYHDIIVDVMPEESSVLGFTNIWYKKGLNKFFEYQLNTDTNILLFEIEYFLATKFEALKSNRHGSDYRLNSDFEDIIYVFDNRINILQDLVSKENEAVIFLKNELANLLKRPHINEEIISNLEISNNGSRKNRIIDIWQIFIAG